MGVVISEEQAKKEKIKKWVEALKSGDFKQGQGYLFDGKGYCCLGVYSKVVLGYKDSFLYVDGLVGDDQHKEEINDLYDYLKDFLGETNYGRFIDMNDMGEPFVKIAGAIEKTYLQDE